MREAAVCCAVAGETKRALSLKRIVRVGHCLHGDRTQRARGAGWEYLHVAIDGHSRPLNAEVLSDDGGPTTASFSGAGCRVA